MRLNLEESPHSALTDILHSLMSVEKKTKKLSSSFSESSSLLRRLRTHVGLRLCDSSSSRIVKATAFESDWLKKKVFHLLLCCFFHKFTFIVLFCF